MKDVNLIQFQSLIKNSKYPSFVYNVYTFKKKLEDVLSSLKSDILFELSNNSGNYEILFNLILINLENSNYPKTSNIQAINLWLNKFDISIEDILSDTFKNKDFENAIKTNLSSPFRTSDYYEGDDYKEKFKLQSDFNLFFKYYYSNQLLIFIRDLEHKIKSTKLNEGNKSENKYLKGFKDEYLNAFCKEISHAREITQNSFMQLYDFGITHFGPYLESEITENLLLLDKDKKEDYLNFVLDKISKTPFATIPEDFIDRWLKKYNVDISEFPNFSNEELNKMLRKNYSGYHIELEEQLEIEDIQIDFYCYAAMLEVKKIMSYIETKNKVSFQNDNKEYSIIPKLKWIGKPSQLGFIIASLVNLGYIEAPQRKDGEINYTQFAKIVKQTFDIDTTENTLSKYLNTESEKGQEPLRKFEENGFNIPHIKSVS